MIFPSIKHIKELKLRPSKRLGQNFLIDKNIASKTVQYAKISPGDTVVEVGAGLGALTFFLTQKRANTVCFEKDRQLFKILKNTLPHDSAVLLFNRDILKVSFSDFTGNSNKIVLTGSIPYSITALLFLKFLEESCVIKRAVFIVQKEVAQRFSALPGSKDYGIPSVYCRAYLKTSLHLTIPPECFYPKPKVDSAVIELVPVKKKRWDDEGEGLFRQVIRASFSQRRKTLYNCLKGFIVQKNIDPDLFKKESAGEGIDLKRRAETLSVEEFYKLTFVVNKCLKTILCTAAKTQRHKVI